MMRGRFGRTKVTMCIHCAEARKSPEAMKENLDIIAKRKQEKAIRVENKNKKKEQLNEHF